MGYRSLAMLLLLVLPGRVWAEDATVFPPPHLRVVEAPPERWSQLFQRRRPLRLFWDGTDAFDVEVLERNGWRVVARSVRPGWQSHKLPRGTSIRLRSRDGRVSSTLSPMPVGTPLDLARLKGPNDALVGRNVSDIAVEPDGLWVATLEGGLARWREGKGFETLGRSDGLPSNRVVAVIPAENGAWVGTAGGLARVERVRPPHRPLARRRYLVTRLVTDEQGLPDRYVQALAQQGGQLWVGTYRGLALGEGEDTEFRTVLRPWSVFSLVQGPDRRMWVGYEGLRGLPDGEPIEGISSDLDVYDLEVLPVKGTFLATYQEGAVLLWEGQRFPLWPGSEEDGAYALAKVGNVYLAAGASAGLISLAPGGRMLREWSTDDGLPSTVVNEVVPDLPAHPGEGAWVGTNRGVAWLDVVTGDVHRLPLSRFSAGTPITFLAKHHGRTALAGPDGLVFKGRDTRRERMLQRWRGAGLVTVLHKGLTTWWVYDDRVVQQRPVRRDRSHSVPFAIHTAALADGVLWVGGTGGALRYDRRVGMFAHVQSLGSVTRLRAERDGTLWAIADGTVLSLTPDLEKRVYVRTHHPLDLWPDGGVVWVGTTNGIDVLSKGSGDVLDLLRTADRKVAVQAVAADGRGGCWAATDAGQVLHLDVSVSGGASILKLEPANPPQIHSIQPAGFEAAWVLTDQGVYAVKRPIAP